MARKYATVHTAFWFGWVRDCSVDAALMYLLLVSQPDVSACGVLPFAPDRWADMVANLTVRRATQGVRELEQKSKVLVDNRTQEAFLVRYLTHDRVLTSPNRLKSASAAYGAIHSQAIRDAVVADLPEYVRPMFPQWIGEASPKQVAALLKRGVPLGPAADDAGFGQQQLRVVEPSTSPSTNGGYPQPGGGEPFREGFREGYVDHLPRTANRDTSLPNPSGKGSTRWDPEEQEGFKRGIEKVREESGIRSAREARNA